MAQSETLENSTENGAVPIPFDRYGFTGGLQYTDPSSENRVPIAVYRRRERKWQEMTHSTQSWDKFMEKKFKTVRKRCRKGIPESMRPRAWLCLSGAHYLFHTRKDHERLFEKLCAQSISDKIADEIQRDLHRQFPLHEIFQRTGGHGQKDLYRLLKAWTVLRPSVGYCQAQAPIAAVLLMHLPCEQAFWCFAQICDKFLEGYFSPGLERIKLDGEVLFGLLKKVNKPAYKHLKSQQIEPLLYMTEWFMCLYTRTLPWPTVLRVLDMFFCEGIKVVFRVALVLLSHILRPDTLRLCPSMFETLERLRNIPPAYTDPDFLISECERLPISLSDMEAENRKQVKLFHQSRQQQQQTMASSSSGDGRRGRQHRGGGGGGFVGASSLSSQQQQLLQQKDQQKQQ